jgi:hypothetical protein
VLLGGELKDSGTDGTREFAQEKLKVHTKYLCEAVKGKENLGVQGLDEILKTM